MSQQIFEKLYLSMAIDLGDFITPKGDHQQIKEQCKQTIYIYLIQQSIVF